MFKKPLNCLVCDTILTSENINIRTKADFCQKCYEIQIAVFKQGSKSLPFKMPSQITDYIYLGEEASSTNKEKLQELGIKNILIAAAFLEKHYPKDFNYAYFDLDDFPDADIYKYLDEMVNFIEKSVMNKEKILIHCVSGMSRSASAVIAYMIKSKKMEYQDAFDFVKSKRKIICPNSGFVEQLKKYAEKCKKL